MDSMISLHAYFIERFVSSIPFLIPFIITWLAYRRAPKAISRPSSYIAIGFLLSFAVQVILGIVLAYVVQLPLLPLKLHQEGIPSKDIAVIVSMYNMSFMIVHVVVLLTSLTLVGYGVYKLVSIVKSNLKSH